LLSCIVDVLTVSKSTHSRYSISYVPDTTRRSARQVGLLKWLLRVCHSRIVPILYLVASLNPTQSPNHQTALNMNAIEPSPTFAGLSDALEAFSCVSASGPCADITLWRLAPAVRIRLPFCIILSLIQLVRQSSVVELTTRIIPMNSDISCDGSKRAESVFTNQPARGNMTKSAIQFPDDQIGRLDCKDGWSGWSYEIVPSC